MPVMLPSGSSRTPPQTISKSNFGLKNLDNFDPSPAFSAHAVAMGLAGQKRRTKLSHDPNNTAWSKATDGFGHRMLSAQGWKPGEYLGAENASHASHYTAANASHIRVALREENLGLGAKIGGKANADTFGLATLSGIFGRLNGKSDAEVKKKEANLRDAELRSWQAQKYGFMNFVSGGLLVGDKMEKDGKVVAAATAKATAPSGDIGESTSKKRQVEEAEQAAEEKPQKKSKKDKAETDEPSSDAAATKKSKKEKKRVRSEASEDSTSSEDDAEAETDAASAKAKRQAEKKARREEKERRRAEKAALRASQETADDEKARLKQEKRARKEERRKRKEQKRAARAKEEGTTPSISAPTSAPTSGVATPTLAFGGSRHAVRQRYIQQKRMASMDAKALNEILMIKAVQA
jgi:Pin2-interacting protein X1